MASLSLTYARQNLHGTLVKSREGGNVLPGCCWLMLGGRAKL